MGVVGKLPKTSHGLWLISSFFRFFNGHFRHPVDWYQGAGRAGMIQIEFNGCK